MTIALAILALIALWLCFLAAHALHRNGLAGCCFLLAARFWAAGAAIKAAQQRHSEVWPEYRRQAVEEAR